MGYFTYYQATITSGATLSSEVDLTKGYRNAYLEVPSGTSNTPIPRESRGPFGGSYCRVKQWNPASAVVSLDYAIGSAVTGGLVPLPEGLRFLKLESTSSVDNGATYKIYVAD